MIEKEQFEAEAAVLWKKASSVLRGKFGWVAKEEVEDCVQTSLMRAWERRHQFREEAGVGTWLYTILVNEYLGRKRKESYRKRALEGWKPLLVGSYDGLERWVLNREEIDRQLKGASREKRMFIELRQDGYTIQQIARILKINEHTLKSRVRRGQWPKEE